MMSATTPRARDLHARLQNFMVQHVYPAEAAWHEQLAAAEDRFAPLPLIDELKRKARDAGLWNLFLPPEHGGLSNFDYAPLAELMGRVLWSAEVFNCSAPDTGNMEVLLAYGSEEQRARWLEPLLDGRIRSAFAMTEPAVASSDATNIQTSIVRDGDHYEINGTKWFITGAMHARTAFFIVMGKTDPDNPNRHRQQSQILVPKDTPGVRLRRPLRTFGYDDAPVGHAEVEFRGVRVPLENLILGEGRGFEIAQGRLGPGRIHHCMRLIGCAQRALELGCARAGVRRTFGRTLGEHQSVREALAQSYCEIEQARLLTLRAARSMDEVGAKAARDQIAAAKIAVPTMAQTVLDRIIQIHGAAGLNDDLFLAEAFSYARYCRLADGPDQVHMMSLGKRLVARFAHGAADAGER